MANNGVAEIIERAVMTAGKQLSAVDQKGLRTWSLEGTPLVAFAERKNYYAFYVMDKGVVDAHRAELADMDVGKGCIRFREVTEIEELIPSLVRDSVARAKKGQTRLC